MLVVFYRTLKQLFWMNWCLRLLGDTEKICLVCSLIMTSTNVIVMLPTDNMSFGYMVIWGLETDGQFQAAVSGGYVTSTQIP